MHGRVELLEEKGIVVLRDYNGPSIQREEWEALEYVPWQSSGAEEFAPIPSALGKVECGGFGDQGKPDKDGIWTKNAHRCPTIVHWLLGVGARLGRVHVIKLLPQTYEQAIDLLHLDDNNRLNPEGEGWVVRAWIEL